MYDYFTRGAKCLVCRYDIDTEKRRLAMGFSPAIPQSSSSSAPGNGHTNCWVFVDLFKLSLLQMFLVYSIMHIL